jgi:hypothetical protein
MFVTFIKAAAIVLAILVSAGVGVIIGYFTRSFDDANKSVVDYYNTLVQDYDKNGVYNVISIVNPNHIKDNLRCLKITNQ